MACAGVVGLILACGLASADLAVAQAPPQPAPEAPASGEQQPVLLAADQMTFDEQRGVVTATGNVELSQGDRVVRADSIVYDRNTGVVTATGNIRLQEPGGDVMFADYAELTSDLRDAFVEQIGVLMTDNSRLAGAEGERRAGTLTRLNRAVYSPCNLCKEDPTRAPLWQIRAVRVVHDKEEKEVRYRDAVMEIFGIPIAYTPYLSHPDPSVDRRSGLLTPTGGVRSEMGVFLRTPYYIDIAPDQDATLELGTFSSGSLLLGGQYRKRFDNGRLELNGSVARGDFETPRQDKGTRLRGYAAANGLFDIDETWRWGFDVKRASDETYLRRYHDDRTDVLTSRAFVEGFRGRNYAALNGYAFQDLRFGNPVQEPVVLPMGVYSALGQPGGLLGGRWSFDSSVLATARSEGGADTRRLAIQPGWEREFHSDTGIVTTLSGSLLFAGYMASDVSRANPALSGDDSIERARLFPQGQLTVRYPFVRYGESSQQLIEPITQLTVAPNVDNSRFPNEESLDVEFDEVNLFMANRFPGIDRLDGGSRVSYGLRGSIQGYNQGSASLFLGQSYRFTDDDNFGGGTGLDRKQSDYVGHLSLRPAGWLDLDYRFRYDQETLEPRRHLLNATVGTSLLNVSTAYTFIDQTQDRSATQRDMLEQALVSVGTRFSSNWSFNVAHIQSIEPDPGPRVSQAVLSYEDECLIFQTVARRDYTEDVNSQEVEGSTLFFRFVFKNIGEFVTPGISTSFLGPQP
ncbi:LPS assembly protein LptD [Azospirillum sp. SYSU D00513]|uniref:LPS-assembly protein LptD n=1 Tax=Azospirillum sp. SYSU D00513 TaxID=2812561 RepID=UPI0032B44BEC